MTIRSTSSLVDVAFAVHQRVEELKALVWKIGTHDRALQEAAARKRSRPRRKGKPG